MEPLQRQRSHRHSRRRARRHRRCRQRPRANYSQCNYTRPNFRRCRIAHSPAGRTRPRPHRSPAEVGNLDMRQAWIKPQTALSERLKRPIQLDVTEPESEMPPYMEQLLAHLRLLVGVPFDYLVPDERLLPDESIRFFYLDRSWTDRLVDGAIAVGKIGTREQAHHHGHAPAVNQQLDLTERIVRMIQRGLSGFTDAKADPNADTSPAQAVT